MVGLVFPEVGGVSSGGGDGLVWGVVRGEGPALSDFSFGWDLLPSGNRVAPFVA